MPRFYFHLINDIDVPDEEGQVLSDLEAARAFAIVQSRALVGAMAAEEGRIVLHHRINIEDEDHRVVASVAFREAVTVEA